VAQVTLYLDPETEARMRAAAKSAGMSQSRWVADLIREAEKGGLIAVPFASEHRASEDSVAEHSELGAEEALHYVVRIAKVLWVHGALGSGGDRPPASCHSLCRVDFRQPTLLQKHRQRESQCRIGDTGRGSNVVLVKITSAAERSGLAAEIAAERLPKDSEPTPLAPASFVEDGLPEIATPCRKIQRLAEFSDASP